MSKTQAVPKKAGGMSDDAVRKRTGKGWTEWFAILDSAGGKTMAHKAMAAWLYENHEISGWWSQMVVVAYEQARGLREKHQKPGGYEISISRVLNVPIATAYRACSDEKSRNQWLGEKGLVIRKATPNKKLHITWSDGKTSVELSFLDKGREKCQAVATHRKLTDAKAAARTKKYWSAALDRLKEWLPE